MSARFSLVSTLLGFVLVAASGCAQAEGEVCQRNGDCMGGLRCCDATGAEPAGTTRGLCRTETACVPVTVDAGMVDSAVVMVDGGSDAGGDDAGGDAAADDAGADAAADDAGADAGGDDGGTDGGSADDAGIDGGP